MPTAPSNLPPLPSLSEIIKTHQLSAKKSMGQHFLLEDSWLNRVAASAGSVKDAHVLEVGPGPGGLTRALLATDAAHIYAVEKDARCIAALGSLQAHHPERFTLLEADALAFNLLDAIPAPRMIIANLPYNIGTQLIINWLRLLPEHGPSAWQSMAVMLQYEVAERLIAQPGSKAYGRVSVLSHWLCDGAITMQVPPDAFRPAPKVESAVLCLRPLAQPRYPAPLAALENTVAAAFNQRRKMLRTSLKSLSENVEAWCERAGVAATLRADGCSVEQFCALARTHAH